MNVTLRYAQREDTALILSFIRELAEYEELLDEVVADETTLEEPMSDRTVYRVAGKTLIDLAG